MTTDVKETAFPSYQGTCRGHKPDHWCDLATGCLAGPLTLGGRPCAGESSSTAQEGTLLWGGVSSPDSFLASLRTQRHLHCTWVIIQHLAMSLLQLIQPQLPGALPLQPLRLWRAPSLQFCLLRSLLSGSWKMPRRLGSPCPSRGIGHSSGAWLLYCRTNGLGNQDLGATCSFPLDRGQQNKACVCQPCLHAH